jgi:hypothetical protein
LKANDIITEAVPKHGDKETLHGHTFTFDARRGAWISKTTGRGAEGLLHTTLTRQAAGEKKGMIARGKDAMLDMIGGEEYATRLDPKAGFLTKAVAGVGARLGSLAGNALKKLQDKQPSSQPEPEPEPKPRVKYTPPIKR